MFPWPLFILLALASPFAAQYTEIHSKGYCAMYKHCGYLDHFAYPGPLSCPYNGPAIPISSFPNPVQFKDTLVRFCGARWEKVEEVCCDVENLYSMATRLLDLEQQFLEDCPACWSNWKSLYCEEACSPDQSLFYNVTEIGLDPNGSGNLVVLAAQYYVSEGFGTALYSSCEETKFGTVDALAMDFVGGGANDYKELLEYLGTPKVMGTPIPIEFPFDEIPPFIAPMAALTHSCNTTIQYYQCECKHCSSSCLE